jgi:hypothetical protein
MAACPAACGHRNYSQKAKSYIAFFFRRRRFLVFLAFFAFFALRLRFAMICLLADVWLRFSEPDLAFDPFRRLETGFLTGRGFEGLDSFGLIPKMPIMGLDESLLGISFRIKQPAATYRARFCLLPIGLADMAGVSRSTTTCGIRGATRKKSFRLTTKTSRVALFESKLLEVSVS